MSRRSTNEAKKRSTGTDPSATGPSVLRVAPEELNKGARVSQPFSSGPLGCIKTLKICQSDLDVESFNLLQYNHLGIDTETDGLDYRRDRLRLVTLIGDDNIVLVRNPSHKSIRLRSLMKNSGSKIFHHASFDLKFLYWWCHIKLWMDDVECTKVLSRVIHPNESSGLGSVIRSLTGVELIKDKNITVSDWNVKKLSTEQIVYACEDVGLLQLALNEGATALRLGGRWESYRQARSAVVVRAYVDAEGYEDTQSYEGIPNEKLRRMWEKRRKAMGNP